MRIKAKNPHCCEAMLMAVVEPYTKGIYRCIAMSLKDEGASSRPAYAYQNFTGFKQNEEKCRYRIWLNYCPFCKKSLKKLEAGRG